MRLKDLANEIGITRQELRQELQKTNFGIDPNAKEIPDGLAMGIVRVIGPKYKSRKKEMMRKEEAKRRAEELLKTEEEKAQESVEEEEINEETDEEQSEAEESSVESGRFVFKVSKTVEKKKSIFDEQKKQREEERKQREEERKQEEDKWKNSPKKVKGGVVNVMRKIELGEEGESDERKTKKKKSKKGVSQEKVQKALKRFKTQSLTENDVSTDEQVALLAEEEMRRKLEDESFKAAQSKRRSKVQRQKQIEEKIVKKDGVIEIPPVISVKEFSEKVGVPVSTLISTLINNGIMATMNTGVDFETWLLLSDELSINIKKEQTSHSVEDILEGDLTKLLEDEQENLSERPPVVVVMGHVDHGKTSILDYYRNTKVVDKESGGITQHVGAYQVEINRKKITFIDTPGHEAFTEMRARGAKVTDIAVLVVAADEGIKTQTEEAYNHAKEAGVPIIVAINKIDKEGANVEKIKGDLMALGLTPEEYGGETMMVPVSAKMGDGMDNLLESVLLQAEVLALKANPNRDAIATIVESHLDKALGSVATVIVNTGTLKVGDIFITGSRVGKVRLMKNSLGKSVRKAIPSETVKISGFESVPNTGEILQVVKSEKEAQKRAAKIAELRGETLGHMGLGMSEIISRIQTGKMSTLKVVLKTDTIGSAEAIRQMFEKKINSDEVGVKIIHSGVGAVSESDVMMAAASAGIVIGFNTKADNRVRQIAERENVEIQVYSVIYNLLDDIKKILSGMLSDEEIEVEKGKAEIKAIFMTSKKKQIVGAKVVDGELVNKGIVKIFRGEEELFKTEISNLKSFDKDVSSVKEENECGIQFPKKLDVKEGDIIMCYMLEKRIKTL